MSLFNTISEYFKNKRLKSYEEELRYIKEFFLSNSKPKDTYGLNIWVDFQRREWMLESLIRNINN